MWLEQLDEIMFTKTNYTKTTRKPKFYGVQLRLYARTNSCASGPFFQNTRSVANRVINCNSVEISIINTFFIFSKFPPGTASTILLYYVHFGKLFESYRTIQYRTIMCVFVFTKLCRPDSGAVVKKRGECWMGHIRLNCSRCHTRPQKFCAKLSAR